MADRDPWIKFRPDYWLNDLELQSCSLESQGLLINLMCLMHGTTPYGYLLVGGAQPTDKVMGKVLGVHPTRYRRCLGELLDNRVLRIDEEGQVYSKRMRLDWEKRENARAAGKLGGNPKLLNPPSENGVKTDKNKNKKQEEERDVDTQLSRLFARWEDKIDTVPPADVISGLREILDWLETEIARNGIEGWLPAEEILLLEIDDLASKLPSKKKIGYYQAMVQGKLKDKLEEING